MNRFRRLLLIIVTTGLSAAAFAQFNESGISAGFFDASNEKDINFSEFHLPPLAVLLENAKSTPQIIEHYLDKDSVKMFESVKVMNRKELEARNEVKWEP